MEKQEASLTIYLMAEEENKGGQIFLLVQWLKKKIVGVNMKIIKSISNYVFNIYKFERYCKLHLSVFNWCYTMMGNLPISLSR